MPKKRCVNIRVIRRLGATVTFVGVALAVALAAGCSSSSTSSSTGASAAASGSAAATNQQSSGTPAYLATAMAAVQAGYKGTNQSPPTSGPKAVSGKTVWIVSCSQASPCATAAQGVTSAAATLGWKTRICDGNFDVNGAYVTCLDQAVAAKADGIIVIGIDCTDAPAGLKAAKAAHIPVVNAEGNDCNQALPPAGPSLFAGEANPVGVYPTNVAFYRAMGVMEAEYVIAQTGGAARMINFDFTSNTDGIANQQGIDAVFASCTKCALYSVPISLNQITQQYMTSELQSALLKHPDANAVQAFEAAFWDNGLGSAVQASQASGKKLVGVTCSIDQTTLQQIRSGVLGAAVADDQTWYGYAAADVLNRIFASAPNVSQGFGFQLVDKTHNLPPGNTYTYTGTDYVGTYTKVWTNGA